MINKVTIFLYAPLIVILLLVSCEDVKDDSIPDRDFKQDMRNFVQDISSYSKSIHPTFIIIPQNGHEILTSDGENTGLPETIYINAIDGVGREDLFYGYDNDNIPTTTIDKEYMIDFMDIAKNNGIVVLVTDYCWTSSYMDNSYAQNNEKGYLSFAADHRGLDNIPEYPAIPNNANADNISSLTLVKNFLYLINPSSFSTKTDFLTAIQNTNYDVVIIDLYFDDSDKLTYEDIYSLKTKTNGGSRLLIAYMSIGEAEDYRYYWHSSWKTNSPAWLGNENPDWEGNYKVRYWEKEWQEIIFGNNNSYIKKIIDTGFDGVYLDIIDAFEYYE